MIALGRIRTDTLVSNSIFILASSLTTGAFGFAFWTISARLFTVQQVGLASTMLSAAQLIACCSLLGFNQTSVLALPTSSEPDRLINTGLALVFCAGVVLSTSYVMLAPSLVRDLAFVRDSQWYFLGFVVLTALGGVNLATDSIFIAYQEARYNLLVDGFVQGAVKIVSPVALTWLGTYGMFASAGIATAVAAVCSMVLLMRRFAYRPRLEISGRLIRRELAFSSAAHLAQLLDMLPVLVLPILVVRVRGAQDAAYFFIAFQVASLLYSGVYAITQATFAEGTNHPGSLRDLARRSAYLLLVVPAAAVTFALLGPQVLGLVGQAYRSEGTGMLVVFSLAAVVVAPVSWTTVLLKLSGQLGALVGSSAVRNVGVCVLAASWLHRGLVWVAVAWFVGEAVSLVIPAWVLVRARGTGAGPCQRERNGVTA
ncbi:MAG: oligosaccharide flippase family protein [Micromonosporaceae bacterium]|nr:oligosaccharide flippase family protein [Micromonosporaceae bacterium]